MASTIQRFLFIGYGITMMWMLLGVRRQDVFSKRRRWVIPYVLVVAALNAAAVTVFGEAYGKLIFFVLHLPTILFFALISSYKGIKLVFVFLTALIFCSLPVMGTNAFSTYIYPVVPPFRNIFYLLIALVVVVAMYHFFRPSFLYMLQYGSKKDFAGFILIPLLCGAYFFLANQNSFAISDREFSLTSNMLVLLVIFSYFLLVTIFKRTRNIQLMKSEQVMLIARLSAADEKMAELYTTTTQAAVYRHDLRHHLSLLGGFAESGDMEKIKEYLAVADGELDAITPTHYCTNQTVNLILSAFDSKAKAKGVTLSVDAQLPEALSIPDTELCAVLSNGLENALTATAQVEDTALRTIRVTCSLNRDKLLIMIENPYQGEICMENGIPTSQQEGHGFGCRSMVAIAEKRKGHCIFKTENGMFILRVVLPM